MSRDDIDGHSVREHVSLPKVGIIADSNPLGGGNISWFALTVQKNYRMIATWHIILPIILKEPEIKLHFSQILSSKQ